MTPKISVVMCVLNEETYIAKAINSLLEQTVQPCEIIVVDKESDDETVNIALSVGDPRIKVYSFPRELSFGEQRQAGVELASGEIIATADGDSYYPQTYLEEGLKGIEQGYVAVTARIRPLRPNILNRIISGVANAWYKEGRGGAMMFYKSLFDAGVEYPPERYHTDCNVWRQFKTLGEVGRPPKFQMLTELPTALEQQVVAIGALAVIAVGGYVVYRKSRKK